MLIRPILSRLFKHQCRREFWVGRSGAATLTTAEGSAKESKPLEGYVISYLQNSCGLSSEKAILASKTVHFDRPDKPDAVVSFLEKQGFTRSQIANVVSNFPSILNYDTEKTLLPKFEFLFSIGMSHTDVIRVFSRKPDLLERSFKHKVMPAYDYFKGVIGAEKANGLLKSGSWVYNVDIERRLKPNVECLRAVGVPVRFISYAFKFCTNILLSDHVKLKRVVEEVKGMGFDPRKSTFIVAIRSRTLEASRKQCVAVYGKWGWTEEDINLAFRIDPSCMAFSEKKISATLDFLVNELGRESRQIARNPKVLCYNLEERIVPRCSVVQLVCLEGLIEKDWNLRVVLSPTEQKFLAKFVTRYCEKMPHLYDFYLLKKASGLIHPILSRPFKHQCRPEFWVGRSGAATLTTAEGSAKESKPLEKGYVISYLQNLCGLSSEKAILASKIVHFDRPDKPDDVVCFLEKQGFTRSQIANVVSNFPRILNYDIEKTLLPKFKFLFSIGMSHTYVIRVFSRNPDLLRRSFKHKVMPAYDYVKGVIGAEKADGLLKSGSRVYNVDIECRLKPNVECLRAVGVTVRFISYAFKFCANILLSDHVKLKRVVEEVKGMGFDPRKLTFMLAIRSRTLEASWKQCVAVYGKWGWTEEDINLAFRIYPSCMVLSEKKISATLNFLVNELGRESRQIARNPQVLFFSLEERIVPRCTVVQLVCLEGLIEKDWSLRVVLSPPEQKFLAKFVTRYSEKMPHLYDFYLSKKASGPAS